MRRQPAGAELVQHVHQPAVAGGQVLHPQLLERFGEHARDRQAVLQQVAQAGRCLGALRHDPPAPVAGARQVEGGDVQKAPARAESAGRPAASAARRRQRATGSARWRAGTRPARSPPSRCR
ncbi:hypothetical protein G6F57_022647 [Rhizopus arrhizus]|nr:hypothetical protein G6F57_022647 [Rhizopus arrhizus]